MRPKSCMIKSLGLRKGANSKTDRKSRFSPTPNKGVYSQTGERNLMSWITRDSIQYLDVETHTRS